MKRGKTAKFAFDPAVVVAFIDFHSAYAHIGVPTRTHHTINFVQVDADTARVLRRWRSGVIEGVTRSGATRLFDKYYLTVPMFEQWADERKLIPVLRGQMTLPNTQQ